MPIYDLDDLELVSRIDRANFLGLVELLPAFAEEGWKLGQVIESLPSVDGVKSLVFLGMGGSATAADICRVVIAPDTPLVTQVVRSDALPRWVGPDSLVCAVSYSGETRETLATVVSAVAHGARVIVVTSGGRLVEYAEAHSIPCVRIPTGLPPRAAFGHMAFSLLGIMARLSICPSIMTDIGETLELLQVRAEEYGRNSRIPDNLAKQLALLLVDTVPVIYGVSDLGQVAAWRWKCQFNENPEIPAFCGGFPEANHNEILGWGGNHPHADAFTVFLLHHGSRMDDTMRTALSLISKAPAALREIHAAGQSALARLVDLCYLGDFTSTYLALARGVDPTPIDLIARLKATIGNSAVNPAPDR